MEPILIVYATREGHTREIAEHIAKTLEAAGAAARVVDAAHPAPDLDIGGHRAAILAASVHAGKHEREMTEFVKAQRSELERIPTVFLSSSLSEAGAEDPARTDESRARAQADAARLIEEFFAATGFRASIAKPIAGALLYTKYSWLVRLIMKRIARKEGGSTDTSRDHDYTDWVALDRFVGDLLASDFQTAPPNRTGAQVRSGS